MRRKVTLLGSLMIGLGLVALVLLAGMTSPAVAGPAIDMQPIVAGGPALEEYVYASWQIPTVSDFAYTRFDAEYSLETGHVYVLGGRLDDSSTDGSIWEFDPVTGVYTDTGQDMPVPVSNYQIARLVDGVGEEVFVLFGGRPSAGGVTNDVQGYKPGSNTVVTYTSTDPYPLATAPGGVAVVNNIAYIFGGFDAVGTTVATNVFDILAAAGSRFTAGPDLGAARSYIPNAVVDGKIYALGGDDFNGSALLPLTITEKLDPSNLGAGWDDAGVADMPIACEEAPAFGFDTNAAYDLAGSIVVAGCGQWPDEIAEVMLYDVATDSWDTSFPDLNEARRNHAGAFVPNGDGTNGQPGMWVWGGIQGADSNVLVIPEYYSVSPLAAFSLVPREQTAFGTGLVTATLGASNLSGALDIFDLSYSHSEGWPVSGPLTVTVADGDLNAFEVVVTVPISADCAQLNVLTVDGVGQVNTTLTDTVDAIVGPFCPTGIGGTIYDANTAQPIPDAYVEIYNVANDSITEGTFADASGQYTLTANIAGDYYLIASAQGYQWSALPAGYPAGADIVTFSKYVLAAHDVTLDAPVMKTDGVAMDAVLYPQEQFTHTFTISNSGTSDLVFAIDSYNDNLSPPPRLSELVEPQPVERIDPRILEEIAASTTGTADFILFLSEQADLSPAYDIADWEARGRFVFDSLQANAAKSQAGLRQTLDGLGLMYRPFISANALLVRNGDQALLQQLAARADVSYVLANDDILLETTLPTLWQRLLFKAQTALAPDTLTWGVQAVNADDVWMDGTVGSGIIVANIDTGVLWTHSALVNQYRGGAGDHDYNWYMPTSGCAGATEPCDNDGHGSHTMGTMVGSTDPLDPLNATEGIGVAPGAEWIACKGCEVNSCSFEALLACGDWMVAPTDLNGLNPDPTKRPHVVNNSWGGDGGDSWYGGVVAAWRASGIFPQFSGGNDGPACNTSGAPGDHWLSYSAAAVDSALNAANFSSRGPAAVSGILKPNISAPGVAVRSSVPPNGYSNFNGTSMASPHVAGTVALLWSAKPELIGEIEDTMWLLSQTASPLLTNDICGGDTPTSHPNHTYGWGLVDAAQTISNAVGITLPWAAISPAGGTVAPGTAVTVEVVFTAPTASGVYSGVLQIAADEPYAPEVLLPLELTVNAPASASFVDNGPVTLGDTAEFTNTSTGTPPLTFLWDFGDGITSTLVSPTHTFSIPQVYTVTLSATNPGGTSIVQAPFAVIEYRIMLPALRYDN